MSITKTVLVCLEGDGRGHKGMDDFYKCICYQIYLVKLFYISLQQNIYF